MSERPFSDEELEQMSIEISEVPVVARLASELHSARASIRQLEGRDADATKHILGMLRVVDEMPPSRISGEMAACISDARRFADAYLADILEMSLRGAR